MRPIATLLVKHEGSLRGFSYHAVYMDKGQTQSQADCAILCFGLLTAPHFDLEIIRLEEAELQGDCRLGDGPEQRAGQFSCHLGFLGCQLLRLPTGGVGCLGV